MLIQIHRAHHAATGQRASYTREATANTTGSLVTGHKVAVKGLMIPGSSDPTLNVLSALSLGTCPSS